MYGFIYITTNHINGKRYIGQRKYDKQGKWKDYLGSGVVLSKAITKYGIENFSKEIIEECNSKKELNEREKYWISYYNAVNSNDFYNIASGGDGGNTLVGYTDKQLKIHSKVLSHALKGVVNQGIDNPNTKQVICLNNMKIFDTTVEAGKYGGVCDVTIQSCCKGITHTAGIDPTTCERLQWEYYYPNKEYELKNIKKKNNHPNIKKVICYTTREIFDSAKEASKKYNISESGIRSCCNFKYSAYGTLSDGTRLQWFYYDYYLSDDFNINSHQIKIKNSDVKIPVYMYDFNGNFIKGFKTQAEANEYLGNHKNGTSQILSCCRDKKPSAFGYIWRFYKKDKIDSIDIKNRVRNKSVLQYSLSMELLNEFENTKEASNYLVNDDSYISGIRNCCNNRIKTAYGYIWKYAS